MISTPVLAHTREELQRDLGGHPSTGLRNRTGRVALVPTMGALHDGHVALIRRARELVDGPVVVSIFVNPLQFGAGEDLDRYPRTLDADLQACAAAGADVVFTPTVDEVYPGGSPAVTVDPGPLGEMLEGAARPTHFRGVLTVVAKLFGLVRPDVAVFGEKDYQQLVLVRRMVADLCLGVDVVGLPTVREPDGLALSSRNRYLDPDQRARASILSRALAAAQERAPYGLPPARWAAMKVLAEDPELELGYLAVRAADLSEVEDYPTGVEGRALVAARFGNTRLIDNVALQLGEDT